MKKILGYFLVASLIISFSFCDDRYVDDRVFPCNYLGDIMIKRGVTIELREVHDVFFQSKDGGWETTAQKIHNKQYNDIPFIIKDSSKFLFSINRNDENQVKWKMIDITYNNIIQPKISFKSRGGRGSEVNTWYLEYCDVLQSDIYGNEFDEVNKLKREGSISQSKYAYQEGVVKERENALSPGSEDELVVDSKYIIFLTKTVNAEILTLLGNPKYTGALCLIFEITDTGHSVFDTHTQDF